MLIDDFMPEFEFGDAQEISVNAAGKTVFRAVQTFNMNESTTIRWMFKLRGIPTENLTLRDFDKANFKILVEQPNDEIVLGLAGQFKTLAGNLIDLAPQNFRDFNEPEYIKAAWNFKLTETGAAKTRVISETRIKTTDETGFAKVNKYWGMLKPPSAMIRNEILKLIKKKAERSGKTK